MCSWKNYLNELSDVLENLSFTDDYGTRVENAEGFSRWLALTDPAIREGRGIFFIGNGASASMASHFAADLGKNGNLRTYTFTDLSLITALANDTSYENVFTDPIRRYMEPRDLLVAISSSGNSPNIVNAVRMALERGSSVVTISGMRLDNAIRSMGLLNVHVPAPEYGLAESAHAAILHYWVDSCIEKIKNGREATRS
jgi:D-sedoheptulose 7-phosphate isomerase